jgi:oxygen-independent coproporphyrinogen III oxidase
LKPEGSIDSGGAQALTTLSGGGPGADPGEGTLDATRPLGVYVHFPFCGVHCPYCDFAVDARAAEAVPHDGYADAVLAELAGRAGWFRGPQGSPRLVSIYFGGGTPGLWRPDALARVLAAVRASFAAPPAAALEITVEANPGEVDEARFCAWREAGVNRVSLGAQSFDDGELARLGRNHSAAAIPAAFAAARRAGFANLTCDLMFGVPGQTADSWRRSVEALCALAPEHVSAYALTVERGTRFGALARAGRLDRPEDDTVAEWLRWGRGALAAAGFEPYEISSYARPGFRAVHNQLYWTQGAYLGLGASAASFRPLADGTGWRFSNVRGTAAYLRAAGRPAPGGPRPARVERRSAGDLENEALWLALRTSDGVDRAAHAARFGADPLADRERQHEAARCQASGWLEVTDQALRLTPEGVLFADEVAARLWRPA